MKKIVQLFILIIILVGKAKGQYYVSISDLNQYSAADVQIRLDNIGLNTQHMNLNAVNIYKILYKTVDINGDTTIASGAISIPQLENCNAFPLVSNHNGTVFNKARVPSNGSCDDLALIFAGNGYVVTMHDYLGLGDNPGFHPYHHWQTEATCSIDLIRATREYLSEHTSIRLNGQIFLTGYSQGGHASMATHKYITENNLFSEFNVVASAPGAGAYDLTGAQIDFIINNNFIYNGAANMVYIIEAYQNIYNNLYDNYNEMYDAPYDSLVPEYFDGSHYGNEIFEMLPYDLYAILQDSIINNILLDTNKTQHPLYIDCRKNNVYNWIPVRPVRMLYCGMDNIVTPQNAISTRDTMIALGATDVLSLDINPAIGHETCWIESSQYVLEWFDSLKISCQISRYDEYHTENTITIYPNPADDFIYIQSNLNCDYADVIDILGNHVLCMDRRNNHQNIMDISHLKRGIYYIVLYKENEIMYTHKFVKY